APSAGGCGGPCRGPPRRLMSFWDMREWMTRLEKEGELRRITAEVDWDRELGAITRRVLEKKGPALLFESIKGYRKGRCTRLIKGGQHWGQHFMKYAARGEPMPVACVIGWDPIMPFLAGSPIPSGICEWDVMGAYRGEPAELVRCETVDLEVPASAEIVLEGVSSDDPATYEVEGPFGEFTGYVSDIPTPRPSMKVTCITHRRDPIFRGTLEGTLP